MTPGLGTRWVSSKGESHKSDKTWHSLSVEQSHKTWHSLSVEQWPVYDPWTWHSLGVKQG
jgi:hypothetical protein